MNKCILNLSKNEMVFKVYFTHNANDPTIAILVITDEPIRVEMLAWQKLMDKLNRFPHGYDITDIDCLGPVIKDV